MIIQVPFETTCNLDAGFVRAMCWQDQRTLFMHPHPSILPVRLVSVLPLIFTATFVVQGWHHIHPAVRNSNDYCSALQSIVSQGSSNTSRKGAFAVANLNLDCLTRLQ